MRRRRRSKILDAIDEEEVVFDTAGEQAVDLLRACRGEALAGCGDLFGQLSPLLPLVVSMSVIGMLGAMAAGAARSECLFVDGSNRRAERAGEWQKASGLCRATRGREARSPTWQAAISAAGSSGDVELLYRCSTRCGQSQV